MATALATPGAQHPPLRWRDPSAIVGYAPLVPVAFALTGGIVLDRAIGVPLPFSLLSAAGCVLAWAITLTARQRGLALVYLLGAVAFLGTAYHHVRITLV